MHTLTTIFTLPGILICLLLPIGALQAEAEEWIDLFDGKTLAGWVKTGGDASFEVKDGAIEGSGAKKTTFLCTEKDYADFELEFEVKLHDPGLNSGVQIRSQRVPNPQQLNTLKGPQIDLGQSPGRSGYIFCQGGGRWITPEKDLVKSSAMKNGEWNKVRVLAEGPRIQTWINGTKVGDVASGKDHEEYPSGAIGLQVHGIRDYDGKPRFVSWRNIRIRER